MKSLFHLLLGAALLLPLVSCTEKHLFSDRAARERLAADFEKKRQELPEGDLFRIFNSASMNREEEEALMFLYAYMPIGDITDYSGEFHLENVRLSLQARQEMPWGRTVPEREFRHFVLPVRVNNENLDESRKVFYAELKDRVKGLSLHDAVLEVNHWCHEKVIYTPSDSRTSSPLASVRTAYGRCGEESTFLVAALRAVGIPARQVYTPRWAHTDDNHAWVEAWVDGTWHFLGACEPEPVLDLGWFNAPASRGMLMHTKVFGNYDGPEDVMQRTAVFTEINVIDNYAPSTKAVITVVDPSGQAVADARVDFKIYNYAEFFTVASKLTGKDGTTSLSAGKGDMLVWASKDGVFGYGKLSFATDTALKIVLDRKEGEVHAVDLDIVPPEESAAAVQVTAGQRAENDRRILVEDSIRNSYTSTFPDRAKREALAASLGLEAEPLSGLLAASRGNHTEISRFLKSTPKEKLPLAIRLLQEISEKDLRDTPASVLEDHLCNSRNGEHLLSDGSILNPRIANEMLTPYKGFFQKAIPAELAEEIRKDPSVWREWCMQHIKVRNDLNPLAIPIMPAGVWKARVADAHSRDIFYVAVLRSLGIAARIDGVTGKTQYADAAGNWQDVRFTSETDRNLPQGMLTAAYTPVKALDNPLYYSHFTLSKFEDGRFNLLTYPEEKSSNWESILKDAQPQDAGYYMLTTGTRLASGAVHARISFFNVEEGSTARTELVMRENPDEVKVIGSVNSEAVFMPEGGDETRSILQTTGRGYFIVGILGAGQEPTNHALRDIAALKNEFEEWGRGMVLLFPTPQQLAHFNREEFPGLPSTVTFGWDKDNAIQQMIQENMKLKDGSLPIFIIGDTFNRIVFISQGYTIGLGEQLMKTIHKL